MKFQTIKKPITIILMVALLGQFLPIQNAQAQDLIGGAKKVLGEIQSKVNQALNAIPELSIVKKPGSIGILNKNPFDNLSFRSDNANFKICLGPSPTESCFSTTIPVIEKGLCIGDKCVCGSGNCSNSWCFGSICLSLGWFGKLDEKEINRLVTPKTFSACLLAIPAFQTALDEDLIENYCENTCEESDNKTQCEFDCFFQQKLEAKKKLQASCLELSRIEKAAAQIAYNAKQIYEDTDPLDSCLFLKNCRTVCQLSFGGLPFKIDAAKILKLFLPLGWVETLKEIVDWIIKIDRAVDALRALLNFWDAVVTFAGKIGDTMHDFVNVFSVLANGSVLRWTDKETWSFVDNIVQFQLLKNDTLLRVEETTSKVALLKEKVMAGSGLDKAKAWDKLAEIFRDFVGKFKEPNNLGGNLPYEQQKKVLDFIDYTTSNPKNLSAIEKVLDDLTNTTNGFLKIKANRISQNHLIQINEYLDNIQRRVDRVRGIESDVDGRTGDVINDTLGRDDMAIGIYGVKLSFRQTGLAGSTGRAAALRDFLDAMEEAELRAETMSQDLTKIEGYVNYLESRADQYFVVQNYTDDETCHIRSVLCPGGTVGACRNSCTALDSACLGARSNCRNMCNINNITTRTLCYAACDGGFSRNRGEAEKEGWYSCDDHCADRCSNTFCTNAICLDACEAGYATCVSTCQDLCDENCTSECTADSCSACWQDKEAFRALLKPIKEAIKQMKSYIGETQEVNGVCDPVLMNTSPTIQRQFFLNTGNLVGGFLNNMSRFRCFFLDLCTYNFFDRAKLYLDVLAVLETMDSKLLIAKNNLSQLEPLLDTPPTNPEEDQGIIEGLFNSADNVFTSPFDYINDLAFKARKAIQEVSDIATALSDRCNSPSSIYRDFQTYLCSTSPTNSNPTENTDEICGEQQYLNIQPDLTELQEKFFGVPVVNNGFFGAINKVVAAGYDLDQSDVSKAEIYNAFSAGEPPSWYSNFLDLLALARKASGYLQDVSSRRIDLMTMEAIEQVYNPDCIPEAESCYELKKLDKPRMTQLLAFAIQNLSMIQGALNDAKEKLTTATAKANTLPQNLSAGSNPIRNVFYNIDVDNFDITTGKATQTSTTTLTFQSTPDEIREAGRRVKSAGELWNDELSKAKTNIALAASFIQSVNGINDAAGKAEDLIKYLDNKLDSPSGFSVGIRDNKDFLSQENLLSLISEQDEEDIFALVQYIKGKAQDILPNTELSRESNEFSLWQMSVKLEAAVKKVMDAFALVIGIRDGYDAYGNIAGGEISESWQKVQKAWKAVQELPGKIRGIFNGEPVEEKDQPTDEMITCASAAAKGYNGQSGARGGMVCPNVDVSSRAVNSEFSRIQTSLKQLELTRRIKKVVELALFSEGRQEAEFINGDVSISATYDDVRVILKMPVRAEQEQPAIVAINNWANTVADRARIVWALNTAIDFANKNCTCGWSFCHKYLCVSDLPLTPQAPSNAYCWLLYILRVPLYKQALKLDALLENGSDFTGVESDNLDKAIDQSIQSQFEMDVDAMTAAIALNPNKCKSKWIYVDGELDTVLLDDPVTNQRCSYVEDVSYVNANYPKLPIPELVTLSDISAGLTLLNSETVKAIQKEYNNNSICVNEATTFCKYFVPKTRGLIQLKNLVAGPPAWTEEQFSVLLGTCDELAKQKALKAACLKAGISPD